ncbi:YgaP-like transmembrane domain [uncultured Paracoccus sp.]|uniref:YgaP-like transmembrane domain n=1 Tax=uncultured Paracoccus sp. TaxID=189685 RepID=UPI0026237EBC|nr:YgaP-like transmembrane domain [uncultured Paracoccus sp.]
MGSADRALRLTIAALLAFAALVTGIFGQGLWFWLVLLVAAVLALTAVFGSCPLYSILGVKTCNRDR